MKPLQLYFFLFILCFTSCKGEEDPSQIIDNPILKVNITNYNVPNINIDNHTHTISLSFEKGSDLSKVELELTLSEGVEMISPSTVKSFYNLNDSSTNIKIKAQNNVLLYKFTIKYYSAFNPTANGWMKITDYENLPPFLSVYKYNKDVDGKKVNAYIAVADMNNSTARFTILGEKVGSKTPAAYYNSSKSSVVMNGGYFWNSQSLGLLISYGTTISQTGSSVSRTYNGASTIYYPTYGAFGQDYDGAFSANWCYTSNNTLYSYPAPSPNKTGESPQKVPSAIFPAGAKIWTPKNAIGAGPVLIKNGVYQNTWEAEMFDSASGVGPEINNPRSAIAFAPSNYLVFFVCEGRNMTPNTPGLTLKNVADLLLNTGCTEAINLDGGGSSCMLINGKETIKPSDGKERSIPNVVVIY